MGLDWLTISLQGLINLKIFAFASSSFVFDESGVLFLLIKADIVNTIIVKSHHGKSSPLASRPFYKQSVPRALAVLEQKINHKIGEYDYPQYYWPGCRVA